MMTLIVVNCPFRSADDLMRDQILVELSFSQMYVIASLPLYNPLAV